MDSLLTLPEAIHLPGMPEHFTALLTSDSGLLVERIVSWGHVTPEGQLVRSEKRRMGPAAGRRRSTGL